MMSRVPRSIAYLAMTAALAVVGSLAGCSATAPGASGTGASGTSASSTSGSSSASGSGATKKLDICGLLPVATVAQISGDSLTVAIPHTDLDSQGIFSCSYENDDGTRLIRIDVTTQNATTAYDLDYTTHGSKDDVSGLGDKAWVGDYSADALFGDVNVHVSTTDTVSQDALKQLLLKVDSLV